MLGEPVARVAERIGETRKIERVVQRRGGRRRGGDGGEVEDRERNHQPEVTVRRGFANRFHRAGGSWQFVRMGRMLMLGLCLALADCASGERDYSGPETTRGGVEVN